MPTVLPRYRKGCRKLILIPRVYTNKPRTTGVATRGMLHQPDPEKQPNMLEGILAIRHMHMRVLRETGLSTADEMLYPEKPPLFIGYDVLCCRRCPLRRNQYHRLVSSGCDVPVGMKNPTSGDLSVMLNSVYAAQHPQTLSSAAGRKSENPLTHTILRGAVNKHGQCRPTTILKTWNFFTAL